MYQVAAAGGGLWVGAFEGYSLGERGDVNPASLLTPVLEAGK